MKEFVVIDFLLENRDQFPEEFSVEQLIDFYKKLGRRNYPSTQKLAQMLSRDHRAFSVGEVNHLNHRPRTVWKFRDVTKDSSPAPENRNEVQLDQNEDLRQIVTIAGPSCSPERNVEGIPSIEG